jgi:membrane-associated protease RseP (regulator of RpoE activity)
MAGRMTETHTAPPAGPPTDPPEATGPTGPSEPTDGWTPEDQRRAFVRLALIVAAAVLASWVTGVSKTVLVVVALILMIMLHELGHFAMAKLAGMKVTEYFLGFGPRLWSVRKGETEYGVKALPLGGYVRIAGMSNIEQVAPEDEARTYRQKGYWQRLGVAVAGSAMHFIIAFCLLIVLFGWVGVPDENHPLPVVDGIVAIKGGASPAQEAGFRVGDRIVTVDGKRTPDWTGLQGYIKARPGQPIRFGVDRAGAELTLMAVPVDRNSVKTADGPLPPTSKPTGFIGIEPKIPVVTKHGPAAVGEAVLGIGRFTKLTVGGIVSIFSPHGVSDYASQLSGKGGKSDGSDRFLSPVGFVRVAGQAASSGARDVLILLVAINVFVGLFNMIPLLPFDGGHVAIATYEAVRSRKGRRYFVDGRKAMAQAYPVVVLLAIIALTSLYLDIVRPMASPFR